MYGLKPHDIFEANDLFENGNMTQVQTTLLALASMVSLKSLDVFYIMSVIESVCCYGVWLDFTISTVTAFCTDSFFSSQAKTKGCQSRVDIGVKYADKQERMFDEEKMKAGQCVIGLQV